MTGVLCMMVGAGQDNNITLQAVNVVATDSAASNASFRLAADRLSYEGENGAFVSGFQWCATAGAPANYEARVTLDSGTSPSGSAVGSWVSLATDATWTVNDPTSDGTPIACSLTLDVRRAGGSIILATSSVSLSAERI